MQERIFISPKKPIPAIVAEWIVQTLRKDKSTAILEKTLVIVPTKSSAKNLREEIFEEIDRENINAISGLSITTLETVIAELTSGQNIATSPQRIAAWLNALANSKNCNCIFPNGMPARENLFETANALDKLSGIVSEKLSSFADVAQFLQNDKSNSNGYELSLWRELEKLELEYKKNLRENSLTCKYEAITSAIENAKLDFDNIVIAVNPDSPALLEKFLESAKRHSKVFILIASDTSATHAFDAIGRPSIPFFENIPIDILEKNTFIFSSIKDEAQAVAELASQYGANAKNIIGVSCEQTENADAFKTAMAKKNILAKIPENRKFAESMLYKLIKIAAEHRESDLFFDFAKALENPLMNLWITSKFEISTSELFRLIDDIRERLVPNTTTALLENLRSKGETKNFEIINIALKCLSDISSDAPDAITKQAEELVLNLEQNLTENQCATFEKEAFKLLKDKVVEIHQAFAIFNFRPAEVSELLLAALQKSGAADDTSEAILLNNWIEIFWSRKPQLLLCDMNDGIVPLAESENQFITDTLKHRLGIKNSSQRRARDTYMLAQLLKTRPNAVQVLFSVKDASEAPIMPSRILMQAENLPERIAFLFQEPASSKLELSAPTLLPIKIDESLPQNFSMSASKFNSYLNSPLDFYVKYILQAREIEADKSEMDAIQFGNLFHLIMRKFALSKIKNSTDAQEISSFLNSELDAISAREFGIEISAQLRVQLFIMRQKLNAVAKVQAQHASEGWQIWGEPERRFKIEIASMIVTGAIDRIDYNEKLKKYLIIDYKTYNNVSQKITQTSHYEKTDENDNPIWTNLQMPLYALAMRPIIDECDCAYFASPQETSETTIDIWSIPEDVLSSAQRKMEEIISDISSGKFLDDNTPKYGICSDTFALSNKTLLTMAKNERI